MQRYFLQLAYNGRNYNGWQIQLNTPRTVQQVLQETLGKMLPEKTVSIMGCGRTDTGVHASDFFAHFETERADLDDDPNDFLFKINKALPHDIAIKAIHKVVENANARFDAFARTYDYRIIRKKNPMMNDFAWLVYGNLDLDKMKKAAEVILKTRNFKSFAKANDQPHDNDCIIYKSEFLEPSEGEIIYRIEANRFIRNMVRALTGTIVQIGRGKIALEDLDQIIADQNRESAGLSAPAMGLTLVKVKYPERIFLNQSVVL